MLTRLLKGLTRPGRRAGNPVRPPGLRTELLEGRDCPALLFTTTDVDSGFGSYQQPLLATLADAATKVGEHITPGSSAANIAVQLLANSNIGTADGRPGYMHYVSSTSTTNLFEAGTIKEAREGTDPNGSAPDIVIRMNLNTYSQYLTSGQSVVSAHVSQVLAHEILHGLGFYSARTSSGALPQNQGNGLLDMTTYDQLTTMSGSDVYFTGAAAQSVYGASVPLSRGNWSHVGNDTGVGAVSVLQNDLMFGGSYFPSNPQVISLLDAAILADLGWGSSYFHQVNPSAAAIMVADGSGNLYATFGTTGGTWKMTAGQGVNGWTQVSSATAAVMTLDGSGNLFASFGSVSGIYKLPAGGGSGSWTAVNPSSAAVLDADSAGNLFATFGSSGGTWLMTAGGGQSNWSSVNSATATQLAAGANGELFAVFGSSGGTWRMAPGQGVNGWTQVNSATAVLLSADASGTLFATFGSSGGTWQMAAGQGVNGWTQVNSNTATKLAADASGNLFAVFGSSGGTWRMAAGQGVNGWTRSDINTASYLAVSSNGLLFTVFNGLSGTWQASS